MAILDITKKLTDLEVKITKGANNSHKQPRRELTYGVTIVKVMDTCQMNGERLKEWQTC